MRKRKGFELPHFHECFMKRLAAMVVSLFLLTVSASALEVEQTPISVDFAFYAIDGDGTLWAWGDSMHGGITSDTDLEWEDAVAEVQNARNADAGFLTGLAVDKDGILWGFGDNHAGKLLDKDASEGAVQLMDHVVSAQVMDTSCRCLKDDGTVWEWGGTDPATGTLYWEPHQILDHVKRLAGSRVILEDDTLVDLRAIDGGGYDVIPVLTHVSDACGTQVLGEDGNLYRLELDETTGWYAQPQLVLENVVTMSNGMAVTADGTLWAWGICRPAMLKDGEPDPEDPYDPDAVDGEDMTPVKIMEGVRYAAGNDANTLAILEDGSLWELPNAHSVSRQTYTEEEIAKVGTSPRKLLDRAAEVTWFETDPDALPPTLLDPPQIEGLAEEISEDMSITAEEPMVEEMTVPWLALIASLLPLAAAAAYHLWKRT